MQARAIAESSRNKRYMESKIFYHHINESFASECARLGLKSIKGMTSAWMSNLSTGTFIFEIAKSRNQRYIPYLGGQFKVNCHLMATEDLQSRDPESSISYMEYYDVADLKRLGEVRDQILQKNVSQKPTDEFFKLMLESHVPLLEMDIGSVIRARQVFQLPYLDTEDVDSMATFLSERLGKTVRGLENEPRFFLL